MLHFYISKYAQSGMLLLAEGSQCRSRHVCMDPRADPLHVSCMLEKSWRVGRALGHCWVLSSGGWPCSFRNSLGFSAEADVSHSKINLSTCRFFAISNKLPEHLHCHILPRVGNKEGCVWHAGIQVLMTKLLWPFVKTKGSTLQFPPRPLQTGSFWPHISVWAFSTVTYIH